MYKFIHAADVHLDSPLRGLVRYEDAPVDELRGATRRALENLVTLAIDEEVRFLLLAGDLYDGDWKDYNTGIFLAKQMGRLVAADIPVFIVAGNHDAASRITKKLQPPANVTIFSTRKAHTVVLESCGVAIHGRGFPTQHVTEDLSADYPDARPGLLNIGLLHTSLGGYPAHGVYAPCSADALAAKGYQYWALGHVHQQVVVRQEPWIVFSGCLQGRHAREIGPKGCMLVTVDDDEIVSVEPHELDVVRWAMETVDLTGAADVEEAVARSRQLVGEVVAATGGRPVGLRLRFEGACELGERLRADPEAWRDQIRALIAEAWPDEVWLEKVEVATRGVHDADAIAELDGALGGLVRSIRQDTLATAEIDGLDALVSSLREKLPRELLEAEDGFDP